MSFVLLSGLPLPWPCSSLCSGPVFVSVLLSSEVRSLCRPSFGHSVVGSLQEASCVTSRAWTWLPQLQTIRFLSLVATSDWSSSGPRLVSFVLVIGSSVFVCCRDCLAPCQSVSSQGQCLCCRAATMAASWCMTLLLRVDHVLLGRSSHLSKPLPLSRGCSAFVLCVCLSSLNHYSWA